MTYWIGLRDRRSSGAGTAGAGSVSAYVSKENLLARLESLDPGRLALALRPWKVRVLYIVWVKNRDITAFCCGAWRRVIELAA